METKQPSAESQVSRTAGPRTGYVVAVVGTAAATLARWVIGEGVGEIPPFITFYPVTVLSAAIGGTWPGLLATLLTTLAAAFFFIEPRGELKVASTADVVGLAMFVGINVGLSLAGGRFWAARRRLELQNAQLQRDDEDLRLQAAALESAANGIVITDREGAIRWANEAFTRLTGYTGAEVLGQNPRLLNSGKHDKAFFKEMWDTILAGRVWHGELVNKRKDGTHYIEEMTITPLTDGQGAVRRFIGIKQNVTERKLAEEAQGRLAAIVEGSDDAILSTTLDGIIQTWNQGAERMFGYRAEEVIGQPVSIIIPADRLEEENQVLERLKREEPIEHYETARVTKDGRRLEVSLTVSPVRDGQGQVIGASRITRDIGEIVEARRLLARGREELELLVEQRTGKLREALAELEGFSYSITHDMRAPLRAMQTFATLAEEDCAGCEHPQGHDYFRRIKLASNRLDHLIQDALDYSKLVREELPIHPVDAATLLRGMIETYPNLQPPGVAIALGFDHLVLLGNESGLTQVFSNLLGNAVKFVAPGVRPSIRVRAETVARGAAGSDGPPTVRLWFEDNGIGIPKQAHEKIFGMFQRMHRVEQYPGTGIGLALVRKGVERMGGRVGVESEPGKGSRFWLELPGASEAPGAASMENAA